MRKKNYFVKKNKHYFHILAQSCLPMALSFSVGFFLLSIVMVWNLETKDLYETYSIKKFQLHMSITCLIMFSSAWFASITSEAALGHHNHYVKKGLVLGFFFFLITEFMLFFSFFWAYFYLCLNPNFLIGNIWPPKKTISLDVWKLPFFNTVLLLASGYTATIAHWILLNQKYNNCYKTRKKFIISLAITILLGVVFLYSQFLEYAYAIPNNLSNNAFWSFFFLLTGFHGIHVFIGTLFLTFNLWRAVLADLRNSFFVDEYKKKLLGLNNITESHQTNEKSFNEKSFNEKSFNEKGITQTITYFYESSKKKNSFFEKTFGKIIENSASHLGFNSDQHVGFEMALFYWHFVDVVWIFLFVFIYVWGF